VYRAIDQFGQVIDVLVSRQRDATAAHRFFQRAMGATKVNPVEVIPRRILNAGLAEGRLPRSGTVRISSYFRTL
jgi:transposase-like protein